MKKHIITISGRPGSGKSSTANKVALELGYKRFSSGDFMRDIAVKRGISLNELSALAEKDPSIDESIDNENKKVGQLENVVVDSRLAFHFIPNSFKVFLDLPLEISKDRVWQSLENNPLRQQSEMLTTPEEVLGKLKARLASEHTRYLDMYNISYDKSSNFDLVVDTNENNLEQVVEIVLAAYKKWVNS